MTAELRCYNLQNSFDLKIDYYLVRMLGTDLISIVKC